MTDGHPDLGALGPELRRLAQTILDGLDPAVRAAAMLIVADGPGKCQQVWCPVCALAALVTGEEHPLLSVIAEHSVTLLAVIRATVSQTGEAPSSPTPPTPPPDSPGGGADGAGGTVNSGYQPISVTIEE